MKTPRKVSLVTGAGRRLGRQIALALAGSGHDIVVNYYTSEKIALKTVELIKQMGVNAIAIRADVSNKIQVKRMIDRIVKQFGHIDVLINNAGIFTDSPLDKITERVWNNTININLKGTFLCSQEVSKYMLMQKSGRIINIASLGGIQAWSKHIPYSVSKAGVIMLTKCLAKSLAPRIMVNAIAPGAIKIEGEQTSDLRFISVNRIPMKRYGIPSDITNLVLFLANTAEYITGQIFSVDGGRSVN